MRDNKGGETTTHNLPIHDKEERCKNPDGNNANLFYMENANLSPIESRNCSEMSTLEKLMLGGLTRMVTCSLNPLY